MLLKLIITNGNKVAFLVALFKRIGVIAFTLSSGGYLMSKFVVFVTDNLPYLIIRKHLVVIS